MTAWLERNASGAFWALLAAHILLWTLIPALFQPNAPLDVIEGLAWGHEWPLGTYKHPPLQAWLLESATYLFGTSGVGYFGLSALFGGLTLWAVYQTGLLFMEKSRALLATLLTQSLFYVNILSTEFNPNVLQLGLGALCGYAFAHALIKGRLFYWLLAGVVFALGLYAKYSFAVFGIAYLLFMIFTRETRRLIFTPHVTMALMASIIVFMPHFLWLVSNQFLPLSYAAERVVAAQNAMEYLLFPVKFLSAQLLAMLGTLALAGLLLFPFNATHPPREARTHLLSWLAWGPLLLAVAVFAASGEKMRDMWGMPLLSFIPLWLMHHFKPHPRRLPVFAAAWGGTALLCLGAFAGNLLLAVPLGYKPLRGHFPGRELSTFMQQQWESRTGTPLRYVIGDAWMAGNVAFYHSHTHERPHVWIDGGEKTSPWIRREDVQRAGALVVWRVYDPASITPPAWAAAYHGMQIQKPVIFKWNTGGSAPPLAVGWGLIPPG